MHVTEACTLISYNGTALQVSNKTRIDDSPSISFFFFTFKSNPHRLPISSSKRKIHQRIVKVLIFSSEKLKRRMNERIFLIFFLR